MRAHILIVCVALNLAVTAMAQTETQEVERVQEALKLTIEVDGTDLVFVQGTQLWIVHQAAAFPEGIKVNGRKWKCRWNNNVSERFTSLDPALSPAEGTSIELKKRGGRGAANLIQRPTPENGHTACIQIADPESGSDKYELVLTWLK